MPDHSPHPYLLRLTRTDGSFSVFTYGENLEQALRGWWTVVALRTTDRATLRRGKSVIMHSEELP